MKRNVDFYQFILSEENIFSRISDIVSMAIDFLPNIALMQPRELSMRFKDSLSYYEQNVLTKQCWKNPELFKSVIDIAQTTDPALFPALEKMLQWQLGIDIKLPQKSEGNTMRFYHFQKCYLAANEIIYLNNENHFHIYRENKSDHITFCLPITNGFAGFIPENIYPAHFKSQGLINEWKSLAEKSIELIRKYSQQLYNEIFQITNYVFLTPDFGDPVRYSYNYRTRYFGALFINPFQTNEISFAESLIHEFIHQRLWMQWAYQLPDLKDYERIIVLSPYTNRQKSLPVMIHAYIIYNILRDFNSFLFASDNLRLNKKDMLVNVIEQADERIPILLKRIQDAIPFGSPFQSLIENFNAVTY